MKKKISKITISKAQDVCLDSFTCAEKMKRLNTNV